MRATFHPFQPFQHGADCCGDGLALVFLAGGDCARWTSKAQDRATSGDPLRVGATAAAGLVERLALFPVELLPTIADMPATDTRQCHGIGRAPAGAVLPELAAGVSQRLPSWEFLKFLNEVNRPRDVAKHQPGRCRPEQN